MAERRYHELDGEFAAYRDTMLPQVRPAGPDAARRTVRRRRQATVGTVAALAVVLTAGPVAGYAAHQRSPESPPVPGTSTEPTPPSPAAPTTPPAGPTPSPPSSAPDGRIDMAELLRSRVDLPEFPDPLGDGACQDLGAGARLVVDDPGPGDAWLRRVAHGDVDSDGADETLIIVRCVLPFGNGREQVVALDRDASGAISTIGRVVATDGEVEWLTELDPRPDGTVRVRVANILPYDDQRPEWAQHQWRGYRLDGRSFRQESGPTTFEPNTALADLRITDAKATFTDRPDEAVRDGKITVTIHNAGGPTARQVRVAVHLDKIKLVRGDAEGWSMCTRVGPTPLDRKPVEWFACFIDEVPAGARRTLTFTVTDPNSPPAGGSGEILVDRWEEHPLPMPDRDPADNRAKLDLG